MVTTKEVMTRTGSSRQSHGLRDGCKSRIQTATERMTQRAGQSQPYHTATAANKQKTTTVTGLVKACS